MELPYDPVIPLLGIYPDKTIIRKDTCTPMFIAALFTIAKTWKQPKCPSTDEWIKMWYVCTMEYYSAIKKEQNNVICSNMGGPRDYTKWSKSDRERQILYDITYMWNLKNSPSKLIYKMKQTHRHRKQTYGYQRGKGGGINWEYGINRYTLPYIK